MQNESSPKEDIKMAASAANAPPMDQDEIELDDDSDDNDNDNDDDDNNNEGPGVVDGEHPSAADDAVPGQQEQVFAEEDIDAEESSALSKSEASKRRLRQLKQKMNQARQLNQQAVKQEGERSTQQGAVQEKKRITAANEKAQQAIWTQQNAKALATASASGVDAKHLTQQAADSVAKAVAKAEKDELNRFSVNDDYNPEGQFRNYQRNIRSLPRNNNNNKHSANLGSTETFNPLEHSVDAEQERQGARRISQEMRRRIEKKRKREQKRKEREEDSGDVSYINLRNKRFNEKINRNYDKHTAEIRQNLERGTAL
jgi:pre-mRNA-splicing factor SYF2